MSNLSNEAIMSLIEQRDSLNEQLRGAEEGLDDLEKEIASLKEQLKREQECTDFYAKKGSWKTNSGRLYTVAENGNYLTICGDYEQMRDELNHRVGGKLARSTQARREK